MLEKEGFENANELLSPKTIQNKIFSGILRINIKGPIKKEKKEKLKRMEFSCLEILMIPIIILDNHLKKIKKIFFIKK